MRKYAKTVRSKGNKNHEQTNCQSYRTDVLNHEKQSKKKNETINKKIKRFMKQMLLNQRNLYKNKIRPLS